MSEAKIKSTFFVETITFSEGKLDVYIKDVGGVLQKISFNFVRSFFFFKESDFWAENENYELEPILNVADEKTLGVFRILKGSMIGTMNSDQFDNEEPFFFWLSTPDECLEIAAFELPEIANL